jgi:L-seryl-tRNA(Ser) seleniumtransferase
VANLQARAEALAGRIHGLPWVRGVEARRDTTLVGGGSLPGMVLPTAVVAIQPEGMSVDDAARALRRLPVPVLARRKDDRLMLDLRSVMPMDDEELAEAAKSNSLV